jgi:hypothetical protein
MKTHAKTKRRTRKAALPRRHYAARRAAEIPAAEPRDRETFTKMETGQPDRDEGRGPLGQEGEGEAQNDQLAALEGIEPKLREEEM